MAPADDWRTRISTWLGSRMLEIERGQLDAAGTALKQQDWRRQFDYTDVPPEVIDRIGRSCEVAADSLQGTLVDTETALKALSRARELLSV